MDLNYDEFLGKEKSDDALAQLADLAEEQAAYELAVKEAEEQLAEAKKALRRVSEDQIPELMDQLHLVKFTTRSGLEINVKETVRASIPKEQTVPALNWLREHGQERLINRDVGLKFKAGQDARAQEAVELLRSAGFGDIEDKAGVHHSRLSAWARERLENGQEVPEDLFGVFRQRVAKLG